MKEEYLRDEMWPDHGYGFRIELRLRGYCENIVCTMCKMSMFVWILAKIVLFIF